MPVAVGDASLRRRRAVERRHNVLASAVLQVLPRPARGNVGVASRDWLFRQSLDGLNRFGVTMWRILRNIAVYLVDEVADEGARFGGAVLEIEYCGRCRLPLLVHGGSARAEQVYRFQYLLQLDALLTWGFGIEESRRATSGDVV